MNEEFDQNVEDKEDIKLQVKIKALKQKNHELKMRLKENESLYNDYNEDIRLFSENLKTLEKKYNEESRMINESFKKTLAMHSDKILELTSLKDSNEKKIKFLKSELENSKKNIQEEKSVDSFNNYLPFDKVKNNIEIHSQNKEELILNETENLKILSNLQQEKKQLLELLENKNEEIMNNKEILEERECHLNIQKSKLFTNQNNHSNPVNSLFEEVETKRKAMSEKYNELKEEYKKAKDLVKIKTNEIHSIKCKKTELSSRLCQFEMESSKMMSEALKQRNQDLEKILTNIENKHNESYLKFTIFGTPDLYWIRILGEANEKLKQIIDSEIRNKSMSIMLESETLRKINQENQHLINKHKENLENIEQITNSKEE